jgi:hypothetical protein
VASKKLNRRNSVTVRVRIEFPHGNNSSEK